MLAGLATGSSVIEGRLDLYSCKLAGADKEVSKSLEQSYLDELASLDELGSSPASAPGTSPVGPLTDSSNRRTLITLILTLNASFPDYDFSSLREWRPASPPPSHPPFGRHHPAPLLGRPALRQLSAAHATLATQGPRTSKRRSRWTMSVVRSTAT